jgi:hypothetical protein
VFVVELARAQAGQDAAQVRDSFQGLFLPGLALLDP